MPFTPRFSRSLGAAFLLALALPISAAHAQGNRAAQLLSDRPPTRRGCGISHDPSPLPSVAELADSAALFQAVSAYARAYPVSGGNTFALYSIAFDEHGAVERVQSLDYLLPQGHDHELTDLVRGALKPQRPGAAWSVRLRLEPGEQTTARVGRSERCPPEMAVRFGLVAPSRAPVQDPAPMRIRVMVGPQGEVRSFELLHGSGIPEVDSWVQQQLINGRFTPGLIDGVPVIMEFEQTLQLHAR